MSRRLVAPVLLLLAAACSLAAVFAVQRIEARGGPVSQPSVVPPAFSPDGDGVQDTASVFFTVRSDEPVRVTVDIAREDGEIVGRLVEREQLRGEQELPLTGAVGRRRLADGTYRVLISVEGDDRRYEPVAPVVIDTRAPIGVLDRATLELGELRGLEQLGPDEFLEVFDARGELVDDATVRQFAPNPESAGAQPLRSAPANTRAIRFTVSLDATPSRIDVVDKAGNRRTVFPDPTGTVVYEANG